jgi:hypothetical protein
MIVLTHIITFLHAAVLALALHPIHVTVTEIEFDQNDKRLEIMMRVFIDDFELALRQELNRPELDVLDASNGMTREMAESYLKEHFRITLDNKPQAIQYLGNERETDAFIFYIEVPKVKKFKTITIYNDVMTALHEDQSNLVHVTVNDEVKSLRLTRHTVSDKLTFDTK